MFRFLEHYQSVWIIKWNEKDEKVLNILFLLMVFFFKFVCVISAPKFI